MPKEVYLSIESSLDSNLQKLRYARLSMTLSSLIEGDFFNTYIKTGNIHIYDPAPLLPGWWPGAWEE
jgi:ribonuclease P/MRP protein subunit RPP40